MTILLTGATGFIGRHLLALLLERGNTVVSYGRSQPEIAPAYASFHRHVSGDLVTGAGLADVPWNEVDQVVHLAAAGVKASRRAWPEAVAVNVIGTQRLLDMLTRLARPPRVFLARTFYEEFVGQAPNLLENPYISTKHAATELGRLFAQTYSGGVIFGNFFQVYGPGDDTGNVLSYAAREFKAGRAPVFGSGSGMRDWIFITDAAAAVYYSMQSPSSRTVDYDIGTSSRTSIREMVEGLSALSGGKTPPVFDPTKDRGDQSLSLFAQKTPPAWMPEVDVSQGLKLLYQSV